MSEATNTPSGDSKKDLYSKNPDTGKIEKNYYGLEERDPERSSNESDTGNGSNTDVKPVEVATSTNDNIQKFGYVGIPIVNVQNRDEYNKLKAAKLKETEEKRKALEDRDKNNDGIEDRNQ